MEKKSYKKRIKIIAIIVGIAILLTVFTWCQNNTIVITEIEYQNDKIPQSFDGTKILQISDLHNKEFGKGQNRLLAKIDEEQPDYIVVTGDLIDRNHTDIDIAMEFVEGARKIAPVYFVSGNHEQNSGVFDELSTKLVQAGVVMLENKSVILQKDGQEIQMFGVADPNFLLATDTNDIEILFDRKLGEVLEEKENNNFSILLSHRAEMIDIYEKNGADLVFSGHAHGGQFRLPFIGGLIAPNQGFFPKYTSGTYEKNNTTMVVSRGLGRSIVPWRLFNRPEIVMVVLKK